MTRRMHKREIKFRAWIHAYCGGIIPHEMYNSMDYSDNYNGDLSEFFSLYKPHFFDIMQYTGLKDKNGKEAYEGDIIPLERIATATKRVRENCVIVWNAKKGMWSYKWPDGYINPGPIDGIENKTIIGNIYENPELLNPSPTNKQQ